MTRPNTKGVLREHIYEMEIGDYFAMQTGEADFSGSNTDIHRLDWQAWGKDVWKEEIPTLPNQGYTTSNGVFYFIKVDDGLLIADRNIKNSMSHYHLRTSENNYIQGRLMTIDGVAGIMRVPTGGIAWADERGNIAYVPPKKMSGGYPLDNEWDKYIVKSNLGGKVVPNDSTVWNHLTHETITQQLKCRGTTQYILRGGSGTGLNLNFRDLSANPWEASFRPVFDFGYKNRY
ncbi:hypothetical protein ABE137_12770 [Brevibacillus laterosporus]|uniref:hypothetical protein n=1 Tax=Brevibacillus laterosporus TaxID=1465 RepID=UPI0006BC9D87|nr:putative cell adhesion domain protein [Brevibacillus phage Sundance]ALA47863.1 putative cell adhesion domain protein [Brevibacillus phage Sundance]